MGPAGGAGFSFNGVFITPGGSYSVTLPSGASVIVSGASISQNPSNPGSVLVSYGGTTHVVFSVSPAGGAAGPSGPSGPGGAAGGIGIDIDIYGGAGGAGSPYGPGGAMGPAGGLSGPAGGAMGPAGGAGFSFNGVFITPGGSYSVTLPS